MMSIKNITATLLAVLILGTAAAARAAQSVTIVPPSHGTVTVSPTDATAGQQVTITVTPHDGYGINKKDITVEATVTPGVAQAPAQAPQVGFFIDIEGEEPTDKSMPTSYTFTMPQEPLNVVVKTTFHELEITAITDVGEWASPARNSQAGYRCDMNGRRVSDDYKGIVIVNGKKLIVR